MALEGAPDLTDRWQHQFSADTPENQRAFPQANTQKISLGFPVMRYVALICLATVLVPRPVPRPLQGEGDGRDGSVSHFAGRAREIERALRGNFAFIKAWKGDRWGNLIYRKTARNFNPMMATAADYVIAEVEELVDLGQLDPNQVHTPGIFVNAILQGPSYEKRIERRTTRGG